MPLAEISFPSIGLQFIPGENLLISTFFYIYESSSMFLEGTFFPHKIIIHGFYILCIYSYNYAWFLPLKIEDIFFLNDKLTNEVK